MGAFPPIRNYDGWGPVITLGGVATGGNFQIVYRSTGLVSGERLHVESESARLQAIWERTDALKRAAPLPPRPPRVKAPRPPVAWPARMQRFRSRTRSTRPISQARSA